MQRIRVKAKAAIQFVSFSLKQLQILTWWMALSPYRNYAGIIADGAIRAGKTVPMALSFVFWAMQEFDGQNFGMCGKSIGSFHRNVWSWLRPALRARGYTVMEVRTGPEKHIVIQHRGRVNYFYIFGGKDERSQDLIQGITLAGIYFDEVALMPESFVNQGTGRCSVTGAKFWFNCNPDGPMHWFKVQWLDKAQEKRLLHLHFIMDDNPSLAEETKTRYKSMYTGVFFQRFILGLWVVAQGAIYRDCWSDEILFIDDDMEPGLCNNPAYRRYIGVDYGTANATVYLDVIDDGRTLWFVNEYYYDSRDEKNGLKQKTDGQYADDMETFIGTDGIAPSFFIIDPSAASFKAELRRRHLKVRETEEIINADHVVVDGIRMVSSMMAQRKMRIHKEKCPVLVKQLLSYVWDEKAITNGGKEKPVKVDDHAPDAARYVVKTMITARRLAA
jgi:PBSX family phage terminase large subunit